jgi:hypothetical protein
MTVTAVQTGSRARKNASAQIVTNAKIRSMPSSSSGGKGEVTVYSSGHFF